MCIEIMAPKWSKPHMFVSVCCSVLHCVAVCCSALQCVAAYCSALHRKRTCSLPILRNIRPLKGACLRYVLQCVAGCCRVLQGVAGCCRVLQGTAVCCNVLQCDA